MSKNIQQCLRFAGQFFLLALIFCFSTAPKDSYSFPWKAQPSEERYEVETFKDIQYYDGPDAVGYRHQLNLFVPVGKEDFPVLQFVHGSAWFIPLTFKDQVIPFIGSYEALGEGLASRGIGVVIANHRVDELHPAHITDVARAWAWAYENIGTYGGDNSKMFIMGHSSGAHLAALLATDHSYLESLNVPLESMNGVICMGGVFEVSGLDFIFGSDPEVLAQASPSNNVDSDLPPFMLVLGSRDWRIFWDSSIPFARQLHENGVLYDFNIMWGHGHITSIGQIGLEGERITGKIEDFIKW
ncbi:MAG: alpha/beta hydrolase [Opitutales bacterium]